MKRDPDLLRLAATDLTAFAGCSHATTLDLAVADGRLAAPPFYPDPSRDLLRARSRAQEAAYLAKRSATGTVESIPEHAPDAAAQAAGAMARGISLIHQATLTHDRWYGRADFLRRIEAPSARWPWSYEVIDAKLARSAKASAVLQMAFYTELLARAQGTRPARMTLLLGDLTEQHFLTSRYEAYFRYVRRGLESALATPRTTSYPDPVEACDTCDWLSACDKRRRADDHLAFVAGITSSQRRALDGIGARTMRALAVLPLPPQPARSAVDGIGAPALLRIREQARVQVAAQMTGQPVYELLADVDEGCGLARLPAPSPGDLFLDFEGDPFALEDGLEYLIGVAEPSLSIGSEPPYRAFWAFDRAGERAAFEALIALVTERRARHPDMHVYHYAAYEPSAMKRLACRYGVCVDALDALLRGKVLVDLYAVVRQSVRASVESYSLKKLEPFYGFVRTVALRDANACLGAFEAWLELRGTATPHDELRGGIEGYNRDDCISTLHLRTWLEARRAELETRTGRPIARPGLVPDAPSETLADHLERVRPVMDALLAGLPAEPDSYDDDQRARYILAHSLEWHRREQKSAHWEYHALCELSDEELREDKTAIAGLAYEGSPRKEARSIVHRYRFPPQDHAMDRALEVHDPRRKGDAGRFASDIDDANGVLELKRGAKSEHPHPTALVPKNTVQTKPMDGSLLAFGECVRATGLAAPAPYRAAAALLRRTTTVGGAVLAVQGPPGTGKTYRAGHLIVDALAAGQRVGVTATSHKVITKLLDRACACARERGVSLLAIQKPKEGGTDGSSDPFVRLTDANADVLAALESGEANVAAGTAWLWARDDMRSKVDVLFIDEAGQMALAYALAAAPAANRLVLLGDPQQLDQPQKGIHPPGVSVSALGHILGDAATLPAERGLFLEETWRMHPDVCTFISDVFYEGRLRSRPELARQRLDAPDPLSGTGLRFVPVPHRGNQTESVEEVDAVDELVSKLLRGGTTWTDPEGVTRAVDLDDILIVAPYNAHVTAIRKRIPGARVGTVDKFQGQEAPVVVYTMATSTPEDAPRGLEFLYSGNRLNVAISRARCASFLVANPRLFEVRCKTVKQMALANAFCRYLEVAREVALRVPVQRDS